VFVEGIVLVMEVLAIVSLFMSVVLVFNTTMALITQQTNQIGMIKAIGGTTGTVMKIYLTGVLILGLLALAISLPAGVLLAYAITRWFLNLFNIDYPVVRWSGQALMFQALAAIAVPLLAALWPVLKGAVMTVREAIASYGLGGGFGNTRLDRVVERIGRRLLPPAYAMALANTFRRKGRLALSLLVLVTAGTMFLMVMSLSASIQATLDAEFQRRTYNIDLIFEQPQRIDQATQLAESQQGVTNASMWFTQPATILFQGKKTNQAGLGTEIDGVPLDNAMYTPPMVAGRWLQSADDRAVVISRDTATDNHIVLGDTITLDLGEGGKSDWQVVGLYKVIFGGIFRSDAIYAPRAAALVAAKKNPRSDTMYLASTAQNQTEAKAVSDRLEEMFRQQNLKVSVAQNVYADRQSAESQFQVTIIMLLSLAVIVAVVGGVGLTGSLAISVIERTKEVGVMRAIGARSRTIGNMFVLEGVVQGLLSWAIAVPLSYAISRPMASALGNTLFSANLVFRYNAQAVAVWLVIVLVISTLASVIPARSATRISVRQSLAYE
jgi:putative ABC transport system permease protein